MLTFLEWKPVDDALHFAGIAKGKVLRFFDFDPTKEGAAMLTDCNGVAPREARELTCASWAMDGE